MNSNEPVNINELKNGQKIFALCDSEGFVLNQEFFLNCEAAKIRKGHSETQSGVFVLPLKPYQPPE